MMGRMGGAARAILAGLAVALAGAGAVQAAPALWVVKDADSEIFLFGTMHLLSEDAQWRSEALDRAYARASALWFEADLSADPQVLQAVLLEHGFDDTPLKDKLDRRAYRRLGRAMRRAGVPMDRVAYMQPWTAAFILMAEPMRKAGFRAEAGADASLTRDTQADGKTIKAFETWEEQLGFFAQMPPKAQVQFLEDMLDETEQVGDSVAAMQASWTSGQALGDDSDALAAMRAERPELYEALIRKRNLAWAEDIAAVMTGAGVELVNVGALHMVGDDGLPELMRRKGFTVERVQ